MTRKPSTTSVIVLHPLFAALPTPAAQREWLHACRFSTEFLNDPDARVRPAQFARAWSELKRLTGDSQIALRIAANWPVGSFGVVEYVSRSSSTLGEGLEQLARYINTLESSVNLRIVIEGELASVTFERQPKVPEADQLCCAAVVGQMRALCETPIELVEVQFSHACPGDAAAYTRFFGAPVRFDALETRLTVPAATLAARLRTADPKLIALLSRGLDGGAVVDESAVTHRLRRSLRDAIGTQRDDIVAVSRRLGMSRRNLQRCLKDEGASFNAIRDEVRYALATRYLEDGRAVTEISFLLGFSEPSAFFRAFKRWSGKTPFERREDLRRRSNGPSQLS